MINGVNKHVLGQNIGNIYSFGNIEKYRKYLLIVFGNDENYMYLAIAPKLTGAVRSF